MNKELEGETIGRVRRPWADQGGGNGRAPRRTGGETGGGFGWWICVQGGDFASDRLHLAPLAKSSGCREMLIRRISCMVGNAILRNGCAHREHGRGTKSCRGAWSSIQTAAARPAGPSRAGIGLSTGRPTGLQAILLIKAFVDEICQNDLKAFPLMKSASASRCCAAG